MNNRNLSSIFQNGFFLIFLQMPCRLKYNYVTALASFSSYVREIKNGQDTYTKNVMKLGADIMVYSIGMYYSISLIDIHSRQMA